MFFLVFFLFKPPGAGMFQNQKDHFIPDIKQAKEIQKSASIELHECGKCCKSPIFEGKLQVFISYLNEMKTVICPITLPCFNTFYSLFMYYFLQLVLFWRYLNSTMVSFFVRIQLPFPNSNDFVTARFQRGWQIYLTNLFEVFLLNTTRNC